MLRLARRGQRGAMTVVVLWSMATVGLGTAGAIDGVVMSAAQARAAGAADAAAHAAETVLAASPRRDDLSVRAQANGLDCSDLSSTAHADVGAEDDCAPIVAAAMAAATANGGTVIRYRLGPDLRDRRLQAAPGRLTSLAEVAVRRRLPVGPSCSPRPDTESSLCWAVAWSAAQQVDGSPR